MDIDLFRMYPANKPSDPNGQTGTWTLKTTVLAANNEWMTIADKLLRRLDCNGRECIQLPLVLATIVDEPEAAGIDADDGPGPPEPAPIAGLHPTGG